MSSTPDNVQYTKDHEWVATQADGSVRMGITDYAQGALGDIVYIQLPKLNAPVKGSVVYGEVESNPELINSDPYGEGWIAEISQVELSEPLLSAAEYAAITA